MVPIFKICPPKFASDEISKFVLIQEPWQQHWWESIGGSIITGLHASQRSEDLSLSLSLSPFFLCVSETLYVVMHRWRLLSFYQQLLQETSGY